MLPSVSVARHFLCSACKCGCTSLPLGKKRLAGDTYVDVSIEIAVGTLVACDSVDQALTCRCALACHSPADALVPAANKTASSITGVSSTKRHNDGPHFDTRRSGRDLVLDRPEDPDRRVDGDKATLVANVSYHLAGVASAVLLESELTEDSSSTGHGRFFPTPFGRTSNHHAT